MEHNDATYVAVGQHDGILSILMIVDGETKHNVAVPIDDLPDIGPDGRGDAFLASESGIQLSSM